MRRTNVQHAALPCPQTVSPVAGVPSRATHAEPRFWRGLFALLALSAAATTAGCDDDDTTVCVPGETRLCAGEARCAGVQSCLTDGSGFEDQCDCSIAPAENLSSDSSDTVTPVVSRPCTEDSQCGEGLTCLTSQQDVAFFGGGLPNGYCSKECQETTECTSVDARSDCIQDGEGDGYCLRNCTSRTPASAAENKCLGRPDVACNSLALLGLETPGFDRQRGWCLPRCNSNEDCPERVCNLASGVCTDEAPAGAPIGERCETNGDCSSNLCLAISTDGEDRLCSAACRFSIPVAPAGCGYSLNAAVREASCLGPQVQSIFGDEGDGDVGFCLELCDQDTDCAQNAESGWECSLTDGFELRTGRAGVCFRPPTIPDAGPSDAAAASSDSGPSVPDASSAPDAQG